MKLKLDLHVHTEHSIDAFNKPTDIIKRLREQNLDGYAVTDHDTLTGIKPAQVNSDGLIVLPGIEVRAHGAHILALQPTEPIPQNLSMPETVDIIHGQGATAILAHPYGLPRSWVNIDKAKEAALDAIEVANSAQFPYCIMKRLNQRLANKLGLPQTGGSDSHVPETVGRAYTTIEAQGTDTESIVEAIRKGRTTPQGSPITIAERIRKLTIK